MSSMRDRICFVRSSRHSRFGIRSCTHLMRCALHVADGVGVHRILHPSDCPCSGPCIARRLHVDARLLV
jgi:hypothetical protein